MTHHQGDSDRDQDRGHDAGKVQTESKRIKERKQKIDDLESERDKVENHQWDAYERNAQLQAENRELISTNAALAAHLKALTLTIDELRSSVAAVPELVRLVQRHEDDLRTWKADATRQRHDIGSEQHRSVTDVWQQFDDLYTQQIRGLANTLNAQLPSDPDEPRRPMAKLVRDMMAAFFPGSPVWPGGPTDLETLLSRFDPPADQQRLAELTDAARTIHAAAAELSVTYLWTVDKAWIAYHPDQTEFWIDCDEDEPPAFVVRPAFTVNGKVIGTTTVFSSCRPELPG